MVSWIQLESYVQWKPGAAIHMINTCSNKGRDTRRTKKDGSTQALLSQLTTDGIRTLCWKLGIF